MDAFYASVELLRYPELRGRAVVIGGGRDHQPRRRADGTHDFDVLRDYVGRGVVTTSTYEARKLGVFSAMGMMKSAALAPEAILLPVDFDEYRRYSRLFKAAVREIAPVVEDRGIDEIYIDLSELPGVDADGGRAAGLRMKASVREATGLTCSIGITPNKLLSKIASELDKPDGLTLLEHADIPARIWPLAARKVNGIGPKAALKLAEMGLHTIGDIAAADPLVLVARFGRSFGAWLHEASHGRDERPVVTQSEPVSISRETTFERDLHAVRDRAELGAVFTDLCSKLGGDLSRKGYAARTIGIKLRFDDFTTATRAQTLPAHTLDGREIRKAAGQCLKRVDLSRRLRLLGVRAAGLEKLSDLVARGALESRPRPARARRDEHLADELPLFASIGSPSGTKPA
ncbi:MAG TPA: DNA polymerase IV [Caldimonas sp.]|nr:DNA polymerase IV [Caldimonas sp.]